MSLTYQSYLSSLNSGETIIRDNDWGQYYDMEAQILINVNSTRFIPKPKSILNKEPDIESGLKKILENYTYKQSNKTRYKIKCSCITLIIYISHLVLFIILFKSF